MSQRLDSLERATGRQCIMRHGTHRHAGKSLERGAASVSSCDSNPCLFSISKHGRFALVTQGQYFRRKLPSLIQRDLERSKLQNEQSAKADQADMTNTCGGVACLMSWKRKQQSWPEATELCCSPHRENRVQRAYNFSIHSETDRRNKDKSSTPCLVQEFLLCSFMALWMMMSLSVVC